MEENVNDLHIQCTIFNFCVRVTVYYAECIYVFFYQNLVLVAEYHVELLKNTAVTSAVANFWCHKLIAKVNK